MKLGFWIAIIIIALILLSSFFMSTYWLIYRLRYIGFGIIIGLIIGYFIGSKQKKS